MPGHLVGASSACVDDSNSCALFAVWKSWAAAVKGSMLGSAARQLFFWQRQEAYWDSQPAESTAHSTLAPGSCKLQTLEHRS